MYMATACKTEHDPHNNIADEPNRSRAGSNLIFTTSDRFTKVLI